MPSVSSRFRMRAVVGLACLLATCALRAQDAGTEVAIPDDGLRCAVTEALGKAPDEAVSQDEMATLAELSSTCDQAIVDLTGLEYASGLQILKLPGNAIVDLDPLSDLANLLLLELKDNDIVEIAPLSGLAALSYHVVIGFVLTETWCEETWVRFVQYVPFYGLLIAHTLWRRRRRIPSPPAS